MMKFSSSAVASRTRIVLRWQSGALAGNRFGGPDLACRQVGMLWAKDNDTEATLRESSDGNPSFL